ncbi:MAG: hypothetical protein ACRCYO_11600 [Bacteroidia bacterium]
MKKSTLLFFLFLFTSAVAYAFPKAQVTIRVSDIKIGSDSAKFDGGLKITFDNVSNKPSAIKPIHEIGGFEIGVSVWASGYEKSPILKIMGGNGKGWIINEKYYYRQGEGEWKEFKSLAHEFPLAPGITISSNVKIEEKTGDLPSFKMMRTTSARKAG